MSRSVSEIENEHIRQILIDLGFIEYETEPMWALELAERLFNCGWRKPK